MDINQLRELLAPALQLFTALVVGGVSVSIATQLLKLDWFPLAVSKYPRVTSAVLSVVASIVTIWTSGINYVFVTVIDYIAFVVGTIALSAFTYNRLLKGTTKKDDLNARL